MSRRWRDPEGFRPDRPTGTRGRPSRLQAMAMLLGLVLVGGSVAAASYLVEPDRARSFDVVHGSLFLNDSVAPVAVDLASGRPTIRLIAANQQVHAANMSDMSVVPLQDATLLLNNRTGEFNMVDVTGFVIKHDGTGGVRLPQPGPAFAVASGDSAYIVRTASTATSIYLVDPRSVRTAEQGKKSAPRASRTLPLPAKTGPGSAVTANGSLWLRMGSGVTQFSVGKNAQLATSKHSSIQGVLAVGAAAASATSDATDPASTVGVISHRQIRLEFASGPGRTVSFTPPAGFDRAVPASNAAGRLSFLLHGSRGWSLLSIGADGNDLHGPLLLGAIPADAALVPPAAAPDGSLYTMAEGTGALLRIDGAGRVGPVSTTSPTYPLAHVGNTLAETPGYSDAYAIGRGSRIVINSPVHNNAVVIFTDKRQPQVMTIAKSAAVEVNALGGVAALTTGRIPPQPARPTKTTATPPTNHQPPGQGITTQIDCRNTAQRPHVPLLTATQIGARTVGLSWRYLVLDQQDCVPSTYVVTVSTIDDGAPVPQSSTVVQGQIGVTLGGLKPNTTYLITVTAFLSKHGATSQPVRVRTDPEGPSAPSGDVGVTVTPGGWTLNWTSCSGGDCLPSAQWQVTPQFCDGLGLSSPPPSSLHPATGGAETVRIAADESTLGRSLSFIVQGIDSTGRLGTPSATTACTQSWAAPDTNAMTLSATAPVAAQSGAPVQVSATLDLGATPTTSIGGQGATVSFILSAVDGVGPSQSSGAITYRAGASTISTTFGSIQPGRAYSVYAVITPPGQNSDASVATASKSVSTSAAWPDLSATASCADAVLTCTLSVDISGVTSGGANGEMFALNNSSLMCGNAAVPLTKAAFDPAGAITFTVSQIGGFWGSDCTVTVGLIEDPALTNPYYGGTPSPTFTVSDVDLGTPDVAALTSDNLTAGWASGGAAVTTTSSNHWSASDLAALTTNWSETLTGPSGDACGSASGVPGTADAVIAVAASCVQESGTWSVQVSYKNAVDGTAGNSTPFTYTFTGTAPGYLPCAPVASDLSAKWGSTSSDPVTVTYADATKIPGCTGWTYTLRRSVPSTQCGTATGAPPATIAIDTAACPGPYVDTWTVNIGYTDTNGNALTLSVDVSGDPPTS